MAPDCGEAPGLLYEGLAHHWHTPGLMATRFGVSASGNDSGAVVANGRRGLWMPLWALILIIVLLVLLIGGGYGYRGRL